MNGAQLAGGLNERGLDEGETARKRVLFDLVLEQFAPLSASPPPHALWVPGRIEIFGRHTDYAGGRSLVGAVPRGFVVVARHRGDGALTMIDAARGERFRLQDGIPVEPRPGSGGADAGITG